MKNDLKITYISWQPYCSRSDNTARELGGKSYKVYCEFLGSNYFTIIFKYLIQSIQTFRILAKERPDVVFVMTPPVFANIPIYIYCTLFQKIYIIDSHSGALLDSTWKRVQFLQRFFCRNALFTIVTNPDLDAVLKRWNCKTVIVPDVPIEYPTTKLPELSSEPNITLVNTYANDEPIEIFLAAAEKFPNVQFHITGKLNKRAKRLVSLTRGQHINFTGFLPDEDYYGLLQASDLIVVLTTRDMTMQRGAYEAIYFGRPVVVSDWPILRENFQHGVIFVDNSTQGIENGIQDALKNILGLTADAQKLKVMKLAAWQINQDRIIRLIAEKLNT